MRRRNIIDAEYLYKTPTQSIRIIARDCDVMIAFIGNNDISNGSMSAIKKAKKLNKAVTIIT